MHLNILGSPMSTPLLQLVDLSDVLWQIKKKEWKVTKFPTILEKFQEFKKRKYSMAFVSAYFLIFFKYVPSVFVLFLHSFLSFHTRDVSSVCHIIVS